MERLIRPTRQQQECIQGGENNARKRRLIITATPTPSVAIPTGRPHEQNPMMNDVILKLLFEKCSSHHRQLNQCRLVCKQWYNVSLPLWLSNGPPIAIRDAGTMSKFIAETQTVPPAEDDLQDVQGIIIGIRRYPKFIIGPEKWLAKFDHFGSSFEGFWNQAGEWLTHLTLGGFHCSDVMSVKNALFSVTTPNLQCLEVGVHGVVKELIPHIIPTALLPPESGKHKHLKTLRINWGGFRSDRSIFELIPFPLDWRILFGHYPNLQDLAIGYHLSHNLNEMIRIIEAINEIRTEDMEKLALNSLVYSYNANHRPFQFHFTAKKYPLSTSFTDLMRQARLKLKEFRLDFCREQSEDYVHTAISLHAKTLTKLEIYKPLLFKSFPGHDYDLKHLKLLTLTGGPVKNLGFLSELPSLRSLRLFYNKRRIDWSDLPYLEDISLLISASQSSCENGSEFPRLSEFCCNYRVLWNSNDIALLRAWFPKLTGLGIALNNTTLRKVVESWPDLEHLTAYGSWVGDKGIAGCAWEDDQLVYNQPNLTNLQKLRSFAVHDLDDSAHPGEETVISQHSVYYGFLKLPRLERLLFEGPINIGSEAKQLILERIPFAKVNIDDDVHDEMDEFRKSRWISSRS